MAALFQLIPTSPELLQHDPLSMLADLLILFCNTKLTFNGPLGTFCHALIGSIHVQEFYHFLPSTYHILNFALQTSTLTQNATGPIGPESPRILWSCKILTGPTYFSLT